MALSFELLLCSNWNWVTAAPFRKIAKEEKTNRGYKEAPRSSQVIECNASPLEPLLPHGSYFEKELTYTLSICWCKLFLLQYGHSIGRNQSERISFQIPWTLLLYLCLQMINKPFSVLSAQYLNHNNDERTLNLPPNQDWIVLTVLTAKRLFKDEIRLNRSKI